MSQAKKLFDECSHLLPANIREGFSVDENMKKAANIIQDITKNARRDMAGDVHASADAGIDVERILTFADLMKPADKGGKYDPYGETKDERYGPIGNFNYGAMGIAIGFEQGVLLRVAGYQRQHGGRDPERGQGEAPYGITAIQGLGGTAPFGDIPAAQADIKRGIAYAHCRGYR